MAKKKTSAKGAHPDDAPTVAVWYHPQMGARIALERPGYAWRIEGQPPVPWTEVARLDVVMRNQYEFKIIAGQSLPRGYLWGNTSMQKFGMSGPFLAYAPIERRCRACKEMFLWPASAQKHLYETIAVGTEKTALLCQPCARRRRALEEARASYAALVAAVKATPTAAAYVRVAKAMVEILEHGGTLSIDRAIGYCTRARKLGAAASVDAVEAKLRALRAKP